MGEDLAGQDVPRAQPDGWIDDRDSLTTAVISRLDAMRSEGWAIQSGVRRGMNAGTAGKFLLTAAIGGIEVDAGGHSPQEAVDDLLRQVDRLQTVD